MPHGIFETWVLAATNPVSHFIEQQGWWVSILLGVLTIGYLILVAAVALLLRRRLGVGIKELLGALAISLGVFVVVMTIYENLALYFRSVPPGSGFERHDRTFAFLATIGVWVIYGLHLALAWWLGRRRIPDRRGAIMTTGAVAVFFVLTFPWVDFLSQCMIGRGLGWPYVTC